MCVQHHETFYYTQQMWMNVALVLTTVTLMQIVLTFLGASDVHVTKDTLEMELPVMVRTYMYAQLCMHL